MSVLQCGSSECLQSAPSNGEYPGNSCQGQRAQQSGGLDSEWPSGSCDPKADGYVGVEMAHGGGVSVYLGLISGVSPVGPLPPQAFP